MSGEDENLLAILGPTNTGKTYTAFEKLFSFSSGIFGFPLRLLARENYDKAVVKIGLNNVALITGEEKIVPKEAKYFFCTSSPCRTIYPRLCYNRRDSISVWLWKRAYFW